MKFNEAVSGYFSLLACNLWEWSKPMNIPILVLSSKGGFCDLGWKLIHSESAIIILTSGSLLVIFLLKRSSNDSLLWFLFVLRNSAFASVPSIRIIPPLSSHGKMSFSQLVVFAFWFPVNKDAFISWVINLLHITFGCLSKIDNLVLIMVQGRYMTYLHFYIYAICGYRSCIKMLPETIASGICKINVVFGCFRDMWVSHIFLMTLMLYALIASISRSFCFY